MTCVSFKISNPDSAGVKMEENLTERVLKNFIFLINNFLVCSILGTPTKLVWPYGHQLAANMSFRFPQCVGGDLSQIIPQASRDAIQLMSDLMSWNPKKRPTSNESLKLVLFRLGLGQVRIRFRLGYI